MLSHLPGQLPLPSLDWTRSALVVSSLVSSSSTLYFPPSLPCLLVMPKPLSHCVHSLALAKVLYSPLPSYHSSRASPNHVAHPFSSNNSLRPSLMRRTPSSNREMREKQDMKRHRRRRQNEKTQP